MKMSEIAIEPAATLKDAQDAFHKYTPRILIFSGHTVMGTLAFEDVSGRLDEHASPESIGKILYGDNDSFPSQPLSGSKSPERVRRKRMHSAWAEAIVQEGDLLEASTTTKVAHFAEVGKGNVSQISPDIRELSKRPTTPRGDAGESPRRAAARRLSFPHILSGRKDMQPMSALLRLECIVLNGCKTESIGRHLLNIAPHVKIVCWSTLSEDNAARAFASGFYEAVHKMLQREPKKRVDTPNKRMLKLKVGLDIDVAFKAGCASFIRQGFSFGDPEDYLHKHGHPHLYRPEFASCPHCTPPVHGKLICYFHAAF